MTDQKLLIGDRVKKAKGYAFPGIVVSVFETLRGETRYVVECNVPAVAGILHIYNGGQLELASGTYKPEAYCPRCGFFNR